MPKHRKSIGRKGQAESEPLFPTEHTEATIRKPGSLRREGSSFSVARTEFGVTLDLVRSAFQKACRRGQEQEAYYWGHELCRFGYYKYFWRVCRTISVEDVGRGDPMCAVRIDALARTASEITEGFKQPHNFGMAEAQAVIDLCRSAKSWEQVHLHLTIVKEVRRTERGEIPARQPRPESYDAHTAEGRRRGVKKSAWWLEGERHEPRASGHFMNGPDADPHSAIHGDEEVCE